MNSRVLGPVGGFRFLVLLVVLAGSVPCAAMAEAKTPVAPSTGAGLAPPVSAAESPGPTVSVGSTASSRPSTSAAAASSVSTSAAAASSVSTSAAAASSVSTSATSATSASTAPTMATSSVATVLITTRPADPIPFPESPTLTTLFGLHRSMQEGRTERRSLQGELVGPEGEGRREPLLARISEVNRQIDDQGRKLEELATGVELKGLEARRKMIFNWSDELQILLGPIVAELRELTERPREIERLRRELAHHKETRLPLIRRALANLEKLGRDLAQAKDGPAKTALVTRLKELHELWLERLREGENALAVTEHQLSERMGANRPFWESIDLRQSAHDLFALFFRSRGRNMLMATLAFLLVFLAFRWVHRRFVAWSPWHRRGERSFLLRLGEVLYHGMTLLGSSGAFLVVLYLYGDWVLLGLSLILIFGLAWVASKGLPRFWTQTQLLLNLGTVREGERVVFRDLPWRVAAINIYSQLENPDIRGGRIRVHLEDLVDLRSRPVVQGEPWFPSKEGDWVLLGDGTRGKVLVQSPEMVELVLLGGTRKVVPVADYIAAAPLNLSRGFRVAFAFGLDYAHQATITEAIPSTLAAFIRKGLAEMGKDEHLECIKVEFDTAGASSLDLWVYADFRGAAAPSSETLRRLISRLCVDCCNAEGWVIPFAQITVHQAAQD